MQIIILNLFEFFRMIPRIYRISFESTLKKVKIKSASFPTLKKLEKMYAHMCTLNDTSLRKALSLSDNIMIEEGRYCECLD